MRNNHSKNSEYLNFVDSTTQNQKPLIAVRGNVEVTRAFQGEENFIVRRHNTRVGDKSKAVVHYDPLTGGYRVGLPDSAYANAVNAPSTTGNTSGTPPTFPQQPSQPSGGTTGQNPSGGAGTGSGTTTTGGGSTTPGSSGSQSPSGGAGTGSGTTTTGGGTTSQNPGGGAGTGTGTSTGGANTIPSDAQNPGNVINPNADPKNLTPTGNTLPYQNPVTNNIIPQPFYGGGGGGGGFAPDYGGDQGAGTGTNWLNYIGIGLIIAIGAYFITKPKQAA